MNLLNALASIDRLPVMLDFEAGGPGSGRHKMGISMQEHDSVMHLRRNGFKYNAKASVAGTHGYSKQDALGNTHVVNLSKKGFTHSMSKASSKTPSFKQMGSGTHKQLGDYVAGNTKINGPAYKAPSIKMKKSSAI